MAAHRLKNRARLAGMVDLPSERLDTARGVLHTAPDGDFDFRRWDPPASLAPYVSWIWMVRWDRGDRPPYLQSVLPHPAANFVVETETTGTPAVLRTSSGLWGPPRSRFDRSLGGRGRAIGIRFTPGGIAPFLTGPVSEIVDAMAPAPAGWTHAAEVVAATEDPADAVGILVDAIIPPTELDPNIEQVADAVALLEKDRSFTRASQLADHLHLSVRTLHRLFADYVGLGPAWVIRRYRLHEATARASGTVDWAALAAELDYADQAHLVRDFTAMVGMSPTRYVAQVDSVHSAGSTQAASVRSAVSTQANPVHSAGSTQAASVHSAGSTQAISPMQ
jgi:AraC-like DNA-binding protein